MAKEFPHGNPRRRENRLAASSSPYLQQHRMNPVDWYPWGEEAFGEARRRNVPIFLSIGYSTCYWCHVMERESFENDSIAALMNERFVSVKVDREERPDVDDIYMAAVQAFRGQGGWPMSVFLDPTSLKPFWAGTYFPADARFPGIPTFPQVLLGISNAWQSQRLEVLDQAEKLSSAVRERVADQQSAVRLGAEQVTGAVAALLKIHDARSGGFGPAPKFPQPVYLELLLDVRRSAADQTRKAIDAAIQKTLTEMALGGIFDQIGGGFHRYSVDGKWTVPHFEKMLYDNAQLASVYAQAASTYGSPLYRRIARRTVEYVLRELNGGPNSSPDLAIDGFFSAQDAEVNNREGQNYLWMQEQIRALLEPQEAELAIRVYALNEGPNFTDPHHPGDPPANVLRWTAEPAALASSLKSSEHELLSRVERINDAMYADRGTRDQPATDDKIITSWNGLMIAALAKAGSILDRPDFTSAADRAATFILKNLRAADGSLLRTCRVMADGRVNLGASVDAFLEDYASLARGCMELHRAGSDSAGRWLGEAIRLAAEADARFGDPVTGAYFDTLADRSDLFVRTRSAYDGATPSGISVMVNVLIDLFEVTGDRAHFDRALRALRSCSAYIADSPVGAAGSTRAVFRLLMIDPAGVEAMFRTDPSPKASLPPEFTPLEILASVERVVVSPEHPIAVKLLFRIAPGYHINAADPGDGPEVADLIPLRVHIVNGTGITAFADYPEGSTSGSDGRPSVLSGEFELTVVLERQGEWTGRPLIAVTYQACSEDSCLAPQTAELDVAIDQGD